MGSVPPEDEDEPVPRRRFLSILEPLSFPPSTGCSLFSCCLTAQPRNKVLPGIVNPGDCEFLEIGNGRRIRVISMRPFNQGEVPEEGDDNQVAFAQDNGKANDCEQSEESGDEEYWFENAAPRRAPIVQPPPSVYSTRIINKFEPQVQPQMEGMCKRFEDDVISPGRLTRKTMAATTAEVDGFDDDYEDELTVNTNERILEELRETSPVMRNGKTSVALNNMSEMLLEITAETSSPRPSRSPKPVSTETVIFPTTTTSTPPDSRSPLPESSTPSPTRSPDPADDSCHPSPEIPHRQVCPLPDPSHSSPPGRSDQVVVAGGNLGGVVNVAFTSDENFGENDPNSGNLTEATNISILNQEESPDESDAGYTRQRNLEESIRSQIDESFSSSEVTIETRADESHSNPDPVPYETEQSVYSCDLPILFFIHGVGGSADMWSSQFSYFRSQGYHVIAPDMLGHGFSSCPDKPKSYTFTKLFKDILYVFDTYIPDDRTCVIVGHSYGCSFSVALARARADKVATLVLIASGGPTPLAPPPSISKYPGFLVDCFRHILECKFKNQQHKYNPRGKVIKFKEAFDVPSYVFRHVMAGQVWPEGDAGFHRRISVPTLLVYGMRDTLVSLVEECEMERTIPKAYLELVPSAGHCVMLDEPKKLNIMLHKFIKKWTTDNNQRV